MSRAANACPAASARSGSRSCCRGNRESGAGMPVELALELGQAMRDASICGLGPDRCVRDRICLCECPDQALKPAAARPGSHATPSLSGSAFRRVRRSIRGAAADVEKPTVSITIDGRAVDVPAGTTIIDACKTLGIEIPTLCYLETLTPVNACRVCVVEVEGARVLAPACSRKVDPGMVIKTRLAARRSVAQAGAGIAGIVSRPVAPRPARADDEGVRGRPGSLRESMGAPRSGVVASR